MLIRRRVAPLTEEELHQLLDSGPSDTIIFLTGSTNAETLAGDLSALANSNGGYVILGVTAKGTPQKDLDAAALRDRMVEAGLLTDPPLILPTPQIIDHERGSVAVALVTPGLPHIYSLRGRYLTRTAGKSRPLTTPELRRLLFERTDSGFESTLVEDATLSDLDQRQIKRYLDYIEASPQDDVIQILLARGCIALDENAPETGGQTPEERTPEERYRPTVVGTLLFGQDPQRFLRSAEIICVRYSGESMSDVFVRQDVGGTLADQIRQAEAFVTGNMRRGMRLTGMARDEVSEYPISVVREAIVNAVAHRDYSIRGEGIRLLMFSNRLTVYSPGRLPGHVTLENMKDERYSRNEAMVAVLSDLGYIERLGYGIDRMLAAMQELGLAEPAFEETASGFQVTLQSANETLINTGPEPPSVQNLFLNDRQEQALSFVQQNGRITNSDYQKLVPDVSSETIRRDLADMVERDLLIKVGSKRATYYILK